MKVIVAGSRHITNGTIVRYAMLDFLSKCKFTEVVCGCAKGVDELGKNIAQHWGTPVKEFPADWDKHGKAAGPIRNSQMADYADALILVWDGESAGSRNMKEQMWKRGKPVYEIIFKPTYPGFVLEEKPVKGL